MAEVKGLQKLVAQLRQKAAKADRETSAKVTVSYSASYAVHVHENLKAFHRNGQAKFLEQPLRELQNSGVLGKLIADNLKAGKSIAQALLIAGYRLQRDSQKLVPVDTGNLKNSATTTLERV